MSKVVDGGDPRRLLETTQDAPSPNVLIQNLLGVARSEAAPEGARRRARRSVDRVFARGSEKPSKEAAAAEGATRDGAAKSAAAKSSGLPPAAAPTVTSAAATSAVVPSAAVAPAAASAAVAPKSLPPKSLPPMSLPPVERRPGGCGEPCTGCTPFG